jgi:hypothetical protein
MKSPRRPALHDQDFGVSSRRLVLKPPLVKQVEQEKNQEAVFAGFDHWLTLVRISIKSRRATVSK